MTTFNVCWWMVGVVLPWLVPVAVKVRGNVPVPVMGMK